jgi:hypothetical protein
MLFHNDDPYKKCLRENEGGNLVAALGTTRYAAITITQALRFEFRQRVVARAQTATARFREQRGKTEGRLAEGQPKKY